jgi:microcystin-dependent protein
MADPFLAEIRVFGFNFPPTGWAFCDGAILPLSQNTALFALLGTTYGGDGKSTFALPNLAGSAVMGPGQGEGLSVRELGEEAGSASVSLLQSEIPNHSHTMQAATGSADLQAPASDRALARAPVYQSNTTSALDTASPYAVAPAGGDFPHNNRPPSLTLNFCIALQGAFPARSE